MNRVSPIIMLTILILSLNIFHVPGQCLNPGFDGLNHDPGDAISGSISSGNIIRIISIDGEDYIYFGYNTFYPLSILMELYGLEGMDPGLSIDQILKLSIPVIIRVDSINLVELDRIIRGLGGVVKYVYHRFPLISASLPVENVSRILSYKLDITIMPDYILSLNLNESVPMIITGEELNRVEQLYGLDLDGSGIIIGILDTGIDSSHPDFYFPDGSTKIIHNVSFVPGESPHDGYGHGTHVAGIAAGTGAASGGRFRGVAPGAYLANIKVMANNGTGFVSWIIRGIEYAIDNDIDVINLSLGGGTNGIGDDPLSIAVDTAVENGIVVVVASGNSGPYYYTVRSPAISRKAITVGAIFKNWSLVGFSSRGPTGDLRAKPDILAPGVNIIAPLAKDSFLEEIFEARFREEIVEGEGGRYIPLSGTSMAAPHVAGLAALILQLHRDYTPEMVKSAIVASGRDLGLDPFQQGSGVIDGYNALLLPVIPDEASRSMIRDEPIDTYFIFTLMDVSGEAHQIRVRGLKFGDILNNTYDPYEYVDPGFTNIDIEPYETISINIRVTLPGPGIYYGYIWLEIDGVFNLTLIFTYSSLPRLVTNITLHGEYIDALFIAYRVDDGEEVILPSGYKYLEDEEFRYYAWFYLYPGRYKLFVYGQNIDVSDELIEGPVYIATLEVWMPNRGTRYLELDESIVDKYSIPIDYSPEVHLQPYFTIASFLFPWNESYSIFIGGFWNTSGNMDLYLGIRSGGKVFLNLQYAMIPRLQAGELYNLINYSIGYITYSWMMEDNPESLSLSRIDEYRLVSRSQRDSDVMYLGVAVFPPYMDYTFIGLTPYYQGGDYSIGIGWYGDPARTGVVAIGSDGMTFRSFSMLDPRYDNSRIIRSVEPPYFPSIIVRRGVEEYEYINITTLMATSLDPLTVIAEGYSATEIYFNDSKIFEDSETATFNFQSLAYQRLEPGRYIVRSQYKLNYTLYSEAYLEAGFDSRKPVITPPILYSLDLPPVIGGGWEFSVTLLTASGIIYRKFYVSWDSGETWREISMSESTGFLGAFRMYTYTGSISRALGDTLSLKIYVSDIYGNYLSTTLINVSIPEYLDPPYNISIGFDRDLIIEGMDVNINIYADGGIYGLPIYVDGRLYLNILVNGSINLTIPSPKPANGMESISIRGVVSPNTLYRMLKDRDTLFITHPRFMGLEVKTPVFYEWLNDTSLLVRLDMAMDLEVGINISWSRGDPGSRTYITLNESLIQLLNGSIVLNSTGYPTQLKYIISSIMVFVDGYNTSVGGFNRIEINIIWDMVNIEFTDIPSDRVLIGSEVIITGNAYYNYDSKPFNGSIIFNGRVIEVDGGFFRISITSNEAGLWSYGIDGIRDNLYGIYSFNAPLIEIYFDEVAIDYTYGFNESKGLYEVYVWVYFKSDQGPINDAKVSLNGSIARLIGDGLYYYSEERPEKRVRYILEVNYRGVGIISEVISIERQVIEEEPVIEEEEAPEYVDLTYIYVGVVAIVVLASIALYYLKSRRVRM